MYDHDLALRKASVGNLTTTETGAFVDFGGPDVQSMEFMVYVPSAVGTSPTLDVQIDESADGVNPLDHFNFKQITAVGFNYLSIRSNRRYRRAILTVGGTPSGAGFGAVVVAPAPAGRREKW